MASSILASLVFINCHQCYTKGSPMSLKPYHILHDDNMVGSLTIWNMHGVFFPQTIGKLVG
jgi:hypothetical protein